MPGNGNGAGATVAGRRSHTARRRRRWPVVEEERTGGRFLLALSSLLCMWCPPVFRPPMESQDGAAGCFVHTSKFKLLYQTAASGPSGSDGRRRMGIGTARSSVVPVNACGPSSRWGLGWVGAERTRPRGQLRSSTSREDFFFFFYMIERGLVANKSTNTVSSPVSCCARITFPI